MKTILAVLALVATTAWAQEAPREAVKVFTVKPANLDRVQRSLKMVVGDGFVTCEPSSATVVVKTSPMLMPAVVQVVKDLDSITLPAKNLELTFYILEATRAPAEGLAALPPELKPAINQLRGVFAYEGFRLLDTAFIRARSGDWADVNGEAQTSHGGPANYRLRLRPVVSSETTPPTIRMDSLQFKQVLSWRKNEDSGTISSGVSNTEINSNVDLKEGQQVIIGKTGTEGGAALVLVASGKIVE